MDESEQDKIPDGAKVNEESTEKPGRARVIAYMAANVVGIALIIVGVSLLFWVGRPYMSLYLSGSTKVAYQAKADGPAPKDNRIIIPGVLVDAPIIEGFTEEALEIGIGRVVDSAPPGTKGNAIMAGHNYAYFVSGDQNLFSLLHLIDEDMSIYVFWEGQRYTYKMVDKKTVARDDPSILLPTSYEQLTLIASASSWDSATISSTRRLLIRAKPVKTPKK